MVEDHPIGRLDGFRFTVAAERARGRQAAAARRGREAARRASARGARHGAGRRRTTRASCWRGGGADRGAGMPVATLAPGPSLARPRVKLDRALDCLDARAARTGCEARLDALDRRRHAAGASPALVALAAIARDPPATPRAAGRRGASSRRRRHRRRGCRCARRSTRCRPTSASGCARSGVTIGALDLFDPRLLKPRARTLAARAAGGARARPAALAPTARPCWRAAARRDARGGLPPARRAGGADRPGRAHRPRGARCARQGADAPFAPDPALATSMGLEPATIERLMAELGFRAVKGDAGRAGSGAAARRAPRRRRTARHRRVRRARRSGAPWLTPPALPLGCRPGRGRQRCGSTGSCGARGSPRRAAPRRRSPRTARLRIDGRADRPRRTPRCGSATS